MFERDLGIIKEHWESEETISLKDVNLQLLERTAIIESLSKIKFDSLADIGCGNCEDTLHFAKLAKNVDAFDYSNKMISESKEIIKNSSIKNINLENLDLINNELNNLYDAVVTKRTLINLGNFENQKKAIKKIYNSLNKGGHYVMLECSVDGLNNMNKLRKSFSLSEIPMPFHNCHFEMEKLLKHLKKYFEISSINFFSDYFYLTRVVGPSINEDEPFKNDKIFKKLSSAKIIKEHIGAQFLLVLTKK